MNDHKNINSVRRNKTSVITGSSIRVDRIEKTNTIEETESGKNITEEDNEKLQHNIYMQIEQLNKLISILNERVRNLERNIALKEIAGKLSKHYEQSRCHK